MMENDVEVQTELKALENDRRLSKIVLSENQQKIANMIKNEMGQDIQDVLTGKKVVQEPFWSRFKYKVNFYLNKFFEAI